MSTSFGDEINNTLSNLREMANDEELTREQQLEATKALDKLNHIFNEMLGVNKLLKTKLQEKTHREPPAEVVVPPKQSKPLQLVDKKDNYVKVKFLLLKCKELHELLQKYDTPVTMLDQPKVVVSSICLQYHKNINIHELTCFTKTPGLLEKKKNYQFQIAGTLRSFHEIAQKVCTDGVIEDLSSMLIRIASGPRTNQADAILDIAHYIINRRSNQNGLSSEIKKESAAARKLKDPLIKVNMRLTTDFLKHAENNCIAGKSKSKRKSPTRKSDANYESLSSEMKEADYNKEGIPKEILSAIYESQTKEVAEAIIKFATVKPIKKQTMSCTNFLKQLKAEEGIDLMSKSDVKWAEEVLCSDKKNQISCTEQKTVTSFTGPEVQSFSTRILTSTFPKLRGKSNFFAEAQPPKLDAKPTVQKYSLSGKAERVRSNTSMYYAKAKRLANKQSQKLEYGNDEDSDDDSDVISQHLFTDRDPDHIKRDEEIKKYLDRITSIRNEAIERYGYPKSSMGFRKEPSDDFQNSIGIRITVPDSNIIKEKLAKLDPRKSITKAKSSFFY